MCLCWLSPRSSARFASLRYLLASPYNGCSGGPSMETPVILSAVRTPIGKFQGGLSGFSAPELGAKVVAEAIRRAGLDAKQIDEAILGNVVQAGLGQNPARQAALKGGCDPRVAAMTINKVCGSGLKAVALAAQAVQLGESEIVVAGGMESMSNCPVSAAAGPHRLSPGRRKARRLHDSRRPVGCLRRLSHGHDRRTRRRKIRHHPRRAGPLRRRKPPESRSRAQVVLLRGANPAHRSSRRKRASPSSSSTTNRRAKTPPWKC